MKLDQIRTKTTIIILLLIVFVLFIFCVACCDSDYVDGDKMKRNDGQYIPHINMNTLKVYLINGNYYVTVEEGGSVQQIVCFSPERNCCSSQGMKLIKNYDVGFLKNMSAADITYLLGSPHTDLGSGLYIPAYITEDAYLIYFYFENDIVVKVAKKDLLTNEVVN